MKRDQAIQEMIRIGRRMYRRGYIVAAEGNLSLRASTEEILVTASGVCKGELTAADIIALDTKGKIIAGDKRVSTEVAMHLEVYRQRPEVQAAIHAHPPYCIALMISGYSLDKPLLPEHVVLLGKVPKVPYARPSTGQVPRSIIPWIRRTDVLLLDRHGSLTVGSSLAEAFLKLEVLEHAAKVYWAALQVGAVRELPREEVRELLRLRQSTYGIRWPVIPF